MKHPNCFTEDAVIDYEGRTLELSLKEQKALLGGSAHFHSARDPTTWLSVAVFNAVTRKYRDVPQTVVLDLSALALGIDRAALISRIRWNENYMRWHDGVPYSVLDDSIAE